MDGHARAGFRNVAVHAYETVDPRVVESVATHRVADLRRFARAAPLRSGQAAGTGPAATSRLRPESTVRFRPSSVRAPRMT
ncbi:MAG: HepT-like ribonuclease domain-containing protein [Polyangiaceae bacterium]